MASPERKLAVLRSPIAIDEIHGVWLWNAQHYSPAHADAYIQFLEQRLDDLASQYAKGAVVSGRPDLRFVIIRRKAKGHGHIAVYRIGAKAIDLVHIFHTSQNWQAKLADESPNP